MYRVQFMDDGNKKIAYVIASSRTQAKDKIEAAYRHAVITSTEQWPYDMVVV